jgi:hypothetical protein
VTMEIAYCGLDCAACPAFHGAERLSLDERQAVAEQWNIEYGGAHTAADIDCVGCQYEGKHTPHCESLCDIRTCAIEKAVSTCAACADYGCARLAGFIANVPQAKANLEALRPA